MNLNGDEDDGDDITHFSRSDSLLPTRSETRRIEISKGIKTTTQGLTVWVRFHNLSDHFKAR